MKMQMGLLVLLVHLGLGLVHLGLVHLGLLVISVERGESALLICYLHFVSVICDCDKCDLGPLNNDGRVIKSYAALFYPF